MPQNIKIYKFLFHAHITTFDLKAGISSPLIVTWKRSNETATSEQVEMAGGKANINQTLTLPVNMYFDLDEQKFQEKKSVFSFTMKAPKGDKQAGVVYVNLAAQVNDKIEKLANVFTLEKCPVKNSEVSMEITAECVGQKDPESMSVNSTLLPEGNTPSTLSVQSHYVQKQKVKQVTNSPEVNKQNLNPPQKSNGASSQIEQKDRRIKQLQQLAARLQEENKKLKSQLSTQKQVSKKLSSGSEGSLINNLKEQLLKGKQIQNKLQTQIQNYRQQNMQHQRQLSAIRQKMDRIYTTLCGQFDIQQL